MTEYPMSWMWDEDGDEVSGRHTHFSQGHTKDGTAVPIVVLQVDGEPRAVWLFHEALREQFLAEIKARPSGDLEPGERVTIKRGEKKRSQSNPDRSYRSFQVMFEHKRQPSPLDLLSAGVPLGASQPPPMDVDIPFSG
jgi:hypothetical protein